MHFVIHWTFLNTVKPELSLAQYQRAKLSVVSILIFNSTTCTSTHCGTGRQRQRAKGSVVLLVATYFIP